jgi:transcriptional regulator with XRE-family HTH domain
MPQFIGTLLRTRRKELGLTREELARLTGRSYSTIVSFERGEFRPSIASLERLCEALGCTPDTFFTPGDDDDTDPRPTDLGPDVDDWVAKTLATAPPLTKRQAERISAALFGRAS